MMLLRAALLVCLPLALLSKVPITHEVMWQMKRVGAPVPSPDGKWVVVPVNEPAYDDKDAKSDLWIVPAEGSAKPRQITFTKAPEGGVTWSRDSRKIAFATRRDGDESNQIYVLDLTTGGEAMRVTSLANGASAPKFSPDGKSIAFLSAVYPGAMDEEQNKKIAAERKARKFRVRTYETFPIRHWDRWREEVQTHLFVQSLEAGGQPKDVMAGSSLVNSPGYAAAETSTSEDLYAVWAPDGQSLVIAATENKTGAAYESVITNLYKVPANGGAIARISNGKDSYSRPQFRPDGKALYATTEKANNFEYNLDRLVMFAWPTPGEATVVTSEFDRAVGSFAFSPDSSRIYLTAEDAGHEKLYSVAVAGGPVSPVIDLTKGVYTNLTSAERAPSTVLVGTWESAANPLEVVRIDPQRKTHQLLTDFNVAKAAELDLPALREFWFTSKGGRRIHNMIALPPDFSESKKYPLVVLMHGGPHNMWRDQFFLRWNYHLIARPGYVVLLSDYVGSTGYGEKFAQAIQGDPLDTPAKEINEAADYAIAQYSFIDGSRQCAAGASYGGHLANWMQATTTRYKCLVSHAGLINLESQWGTSDAIYSREITNGGPVWEQGKVWREQNPIRFAARFKTPILLSVGENDFRVPLNQTLENWSVLQRMKVPSRLLVWPDENHWIMKGENSRHFYSELQNWLAKYL